ncbi:putative quinol monooxygenase [Piscirickettsia litoralis]|uniref:ABM domain-containing protein n=1 Tax=Piscirickettsia litoralis TaxID=1891921 RepID=A0ABX3A2T4_9GAMM|nr:hypothetical protein [Piscirickettsia litoralis]ODN41690.1 hypothetical protein BGC07_00205 [Piscirickettsia litoralis]
MGSVNSSQDNNYCTVLPYFKIHAGKVGAFKEISQRLVKKTNHEPSCLCYSFSFNEDEAHCQEIYADSAAFLYHLDHVSELLGELFAVAEMTRLEIHAPASIIEELKPALVDFEPKFFTSETGFRR